MLKLAGSPAFLANESCAASSKIRFRRSRKLPVGGGGSRSPEFDAVDRLLSGEFGNDGGSNCGLLDPAVAGGVIGMRVDPLGGRGCIELLGFELSDEFGRGGLTAGVGRGWGRIFGRSSGRLALGWPPPIGNVGIRGEALPGDVCGFAACSCGGGSLAPPRGFSGTRDSAEPNRSLVNDRTNSPGVATSESGNSRNVASSAAVLVANSDCVVIHSPKAMVMTPPARLGFASSIGGWLPSMIAAKSFRLDRRDSK